MRATNDERRGIYESTVRYLRKKLYPTTKKVCYGTRKKALNAGKTRALKTGDRATKSVYQCRFCKDWHTTKQEQR